MYKLVYCLMHKLTIKTNDAVFALFQFSQNTTALLFGDAVSCHGFIFKGHVSVVTVHLKHDTIPGQ